MRARRNTDASGLLSLLAPSVAHSLPRVGGKRLAYGGSHHAASGRERDRTAGGIVGAGFDEFRWPRPVRPGDELHMESEVLEVRPSRSRSNQGLIKVRTTTLNQNDEAMQVQIANLIVPRRQSADVG